MSWQLLGNISGRPGTDGKDGRDADVESIATRAAALVARPKDGSDGVGITGAVIDRDGHLVLTLSNGQTKDVGVVTGQNGAPGARGEDGTNGKDGLGFEDFEVLHDGERGFTFRFLRGDLVKTFGPFVMPMVLDRGVYRPGIGYQKGDGVTWDGSFWVAQLDTPPGKPGTPESGWRLAVKRGGDGKTGPQGPMGERGMKGDKGDPGKGY